MDHPLSDRSVVLFLAERGFEVSCRPVLRWVQTFGPLLAAEVRRLRRSPRHRLWLVRSAPHATLFRM